MRFIRPFLLKSLEIFGLISDLGFVDAAKVSRSSWFVCMALWLAIPGWLAAQESNREERAPDFEPLIERYMLDEIKALRQEQLTIQARIREDVANIKADSVDRMVGYATSTVNVVFFVITGGATLLALVGWTSLRDMKKRIDGVVEAKVEAASEDYTTRLEKLEERLKRRSEDIISAHEEIAKTNAVHSLWLRAGLESNPRLKIEIYDEILTYNRKDVEALTYQADAVLELKEPHWALNLCNIALSYDKDYAYGYWQRACAFAILGSVEHAVADLAKAIELSPRLQDEIAREPAFDSIRDSEAFQNTIHPSQGMETLESGGQT